MKRMRRNRDDFYAGDEETDIDIIPLLDVIFLLLTFFIFMTLAMVIQKGVEVELASAKSGQAVEKQDPLVVSVKGDGQYFLGEKRTARKRLRKRLGRMARKNEERPVQLNAAGSARHRDVISALDVIRRSGFSNVTFTVEPSQ